MQNKISLYGKVTVLYHSATITKHFILGHLSAISMCWSLFWSVLDSKVKAPANSVSEKAPPCFQDKGQTPSLKPLDKNCNPTQKSIALMASPPECLTSQYHFGS